MINEAAGLTAALVQIAEPWSKAYAHSKVLSAGTLFFHLAPLVFGAGTAFVMDRATLNISRSGASERAHHLHELSRVHRVVLFGLALSFVSGTLLFLSDIETFVGSIWFWIKLSLVGVLLINGFVMTRTENALARAGDDERMWARMRVLAIASASLWLATTLAGVILKEFA